jgi:coenzyme Q-binding protein COQ10
MEADLVISFKVFRERFGSRVTLLPGEGRILTEYLDGPFRHLRSTWTFRPVEGGSEVEFFVDFEFRNAILQGIIGLVFNEAMQRIVRAFEARAAQLYGQGRA